MTIICSTFTIEYLVRYYIIILLLYIYNYFTLKILLIYDVIKFVINYIMITNYKYIKWF